jgi:flavin reductase (DIM6/NTAB) family NADH-FMN oxidoreductase RutF
MSEPSSGKTFDAKAFWRAIGNRATGSTVVTAAGPDGPAGFLGLSATHLGADPPLMMVSIDKRTSALAAVLAARHFALSFLPRDARAVADAFGGRGVQKGADRFVAGQWDTLTTGAPVFRGAVGAIDCVLEETIERHGVVIAIGHVVAARDGGSATPLIHYRGGILP